MSNISELHSSYQNTSDVTDTNWSVPDASFIDYCDGYRDVDFLIRLIWMYAGYPILALGTVGHLLVIVLVLLHKRLRSLPLSTFLVTMSVSGLIALYVGLLPSIIKHQTCHNERAEDQTTETGCRLFNVAIYFFLQLYSWMEASVSVERMCAVRWPLINRTLAARRSSAIAITAIAAILLAIDCVNFKIFGKSLGTCAVEDGELFQVWQYVHTALYIAVPMAVMIPANIVTLSTINHSLLKSSRHIKKAKPTAIMMFILNAIFVVTTAPMLVGNFNNLSSSEYEAVQVAWVVSRLMMYLGCSLTFLVYVAVASTFRKALSELFVSGKKNILSSALAVSRMGGNFEERLGAHQAAEGNITKTSICVNNSTSSATNGKG